MDKVMSTFAERLAQACRENEDIPEHGRGQQTYLAKKMRVSQEAVRKWFAGESLPKQAAMRKLSDILRVDHVWLALGTSYGEIEKRRVAAGRQDAAVYALAGYLIERGYNVAFADPSEGHDIDAIGHGVHRVIVLRNAAAESKTKWTVRFPLVSMDLAHVAALRKNQSVFAYDFIWISAQQLAEHGYREGNDVCVELKYNAEKNRYSIGSTPIGLFLDQY
jgi:transcriptional regulator with XRE-family HTH domain